MGDNQRLEHRQLSFCLLETDLLRDVGLCQSMRRFAADYFLFCEEALLAAARKTADRRIVFVSSTFEGKVFHKVKCITKEILGPAAIKTFSECSNPPQIPPLSRPMYSLTLDGVVVAVDGFSPSVTARIIKKVQYLGGLVLKRISTSSVRKHRPAFLITNSALCDSYAAALENDITVVSEEWLEKIWNMRNDQRLVVGVEVTPHYLLQGRNLFRNIRVHLLGFSLAACQFWRSAVVSAGGCVDDELSGSTDVIILTEISFRSLHLLSSSPSNNIRTFRFTTENGLDHIQFVTDNRQKVVDVSFLKCSFAKGILVSPSHFDVPGGDGTVQRNSCPKRTLSLQSASTAVVSSHKSLQTAKRTMPRRPGVSPAAKLKKLTIRTPATKKSEDTADRVAQPVPPSPSPSTSFAQPFPCSPPIAQEPIASERWYRVMEILNTERNYTRILAAVWNNIVTPLKDCCSDENALLEFPQIHAIFRNLFDLLMLHQEVVRELESSTTPWSEFCQIGQIWVKHASTFAQLYAPYINSHESAKTMFEKCLAEKPAFRNFINRALETPEFSRNSLPDILIRPVQRLPSLLLLLRELAKKTDQTHPDHQFLQIAVSDLDQVLNALNEGKREAENLGQTSSIPVREGRSASQITLKTRNQAWEKARRLSSKTTDKLAKVFSFGHHPKSSGLKRAASQAVLVPAKNAKTEENVEKDVMN